MKMTAIRRSSERRASRSTTDACVVTSSAVVGSSAISTAGSQASAIAIITRWRMPPENSCGYWAIRLSGVGTPTSRSSSTACSSASRRLTSRCSRIASRSCAPTVITGFSEPSASWKIMAIVPPRTARSSRSLARRRSISPQRSSPREMRPGGSIRPRIASASVDLPEPDSPTMPMRCPGSTVRLTPSTAVTTPCSVGNSTTRSEIWRTAEPVGATSAGAASVPAPCGVTPPPPAPRRAHRVRRPQSRGRAGGSRHGARARPRRRPRRACSRATRARCTRRGRCPPTSRGT